MSRYPEYSERDELLARWLAVALWLGVLCGSVAMLVWAWA